MSTSHTNALQKRKAKNVNTHWLHRRT